LSTDSLDLLPNLELAPDEENDTFRSRQGHVLSIFHTVLIDSMALLFELFLVSRLPIVTLSTTYMSLHVLHDEMLLTWNVVPDFPVQPPKVFGYERVCNRHLIEKTI
jgi:hypothetical protein